MRPGRIEFIYSMLVLQGDARSVTLSSILCDFLQWDSDAETTMRIRYLVAISENVMERTNERTRLVFSGDYFTKG